MSKLLDAWQNFENEFLSALAAQYNQEDEKEYIEPLRSAILEAAQQDEKQFCPYCKKVHNLMLACPEYKDFVEWRDREKLIASRH